MQRETTTDRSTSPKSVLDYPWTKTVDEIKQAYDVNDDVGLSDDRIEQGLRKYGPNGRFPFSFEIIIRFCLNRVAG